MYMYPIIVITLTFELVLIFAVFPKNLISFIYFIKYILILFFLPPKQNDIKKNNPASKTNQAIHGVHFVLAMGSSCPKHGALKCLMYPVTLPWRKSTLPF